MMHQQKWLDILVCSDKKKNINVQTNKENIEEYGKYYVKMLTINFDEKSHLATFNMVTNDSNSRRVIARFLSANQIASVFVENKVFTLNDFFKNFLK